MTALDDRATASAVIRRAHEVVPPVNLDAVVRLWPGLRITLEDLDGPGYLLDLGVHGGEILARSADPPARRRFTIAHELGHWVLAQSTDQVGTTPAAEALERWCDRFATELLMPASWIRRDLDVTPWTQLPRAILRLPAKYGVSQEAAYGRVADVTPMTVLQIRVAGDGTPSLLRSYPRTASMRLPQSVIDEAMRSARQATGARPTEQLIDSHRLLSKITLVLPDRIERLVVAVPA